MEGFNAFDLLFVSGPALKEIYKMGGLPKSDDLLELTPEQYQKYYETAKDTGEKVFMYLPKDPQVYAALASADEVMVFTEGDLAIFQRAWQIVEIYCVRKDMQNASEEEKLACAAAFLPSVFTEGTRFEKYHKSRMFPVLTSEQQD